MSIVGINSNERYEVEKGVSKGHLQRVRRVIGWLCCLGRGLIIIFEVCLKRILQPLVNLLLGSLAPRLAVLDLIATS